MGYFSESETDLVFYDDPYLQEISVWLDQYDPGGPTVVPDKTIFHPQGGGQKGDRGKLIIPAAGNAEAVIVDTTAKEGVVYHHLALPFQEDVSIEGQKAELQLDWPYRYRQMKLHTVAHLIHFSIERELGSKLPFPKTSDIQDEFGFNVYELADAFTQEDVDRATRKLNNFLSEGHEIKTYSHPTKPGFRYWECEGIKVPCGGVHPRNTTEIGEIRAEATQKRGTSRVNFTLTS